MNRDSELLILKNKAGKGMEIYLHLHYRSLVENALHSVDIGDTDILQVIDGLSKDEDPLVEIGRIYPELLIREVMMNTLILSPYTYKLLDSMLANGVSHMYHGFGLLRIQDLAYEDENRMISLAVAGIVFRALNIVRHVEVNTEVISKLVSDGMNLVISVIDENLSNDSVFEDDFNSLISEKRENLILGVTNYNGGATFMEGYIMSIYTQIRDAIS